jgi:hypothetical protein
MLSDTFIDGPALGKSAVARSPTLQAAEPRQSNSPRCSPAAIRPSDAADLTMKQSSLATIAFTSENIYGPLALEIGDMYS